MNWYAIYTKARAEDSTTQLLSKAGIETLNPKLRVKKYVRKRYVDVVEQLFPSYIFARLDISTHHYMVKYTRGVKYIVGQEHPLIVHPEIILAIRERMEGDVIQPETERFEKGDRVLIKEGPFKHFYGIFERNVPGKERAMILLEALHCTLDIESYSIRKA